MQSKCGRTMPTVQSKTIHWCQRCKHLNSLLFSTASSHHESLKNSFLPMPKYFKTSSIVKNHVKNVLSMSRYRAWSGFIPEYRDAIATVLRKITNMTTFWNLQDHSAGDNPRNISVCFKHTFVDQHSRSWCRMCCKVNANIRKTCHTLPSGLPCIHAYWVFLRRSSDTPFQQMYPLEDLREKTCSTKKEHVQPPDRAAFSAEWRIC